MLHIDIEDYEKEESYIDLSDNEYWENHQIFVLNTDEIGINIAYQLFDAEYLITQEILDEEINDYLSNIHERIIEKIIQVLDDNGIDVY